MGLLWFFPGFWQTPTLLVLQHARNGQLINWTVPAQAGQFNAPVSGLTVSGWTVMPGAAVNGAQPPDQLVSFYVAGRTKPKLLCLLDVRYFPLRGVWQPYYRMNEQMFFSHKGGRWMPLNLLNGVPALVTETPIGFANASGYYRALSFAKTTGPITLTGWTVQTEAPNSLPAP